MQTLVVSEWAGCGPVTAVHPALAAVTHGLQLDDLTLSCTSRGNISKQRAAGAQS